MKKFILTIFVLIVLLIGTVAYFFIRSLNADAYKQQIITSISDLTGKTMSIRGKASLKWLPMPTLVMENISLSNHPGSDKKEMLTADSILVQIEWASLFKSPFVVKQVELNKPILHLERLVSNRANWDLPFFTAPDANVNDDLFLGGSQTITTTKIEQLKIKNGQIFYENKITGQSGKIQNINGDISINSLKGPYTFSGDVTIEKNTFKTTISADKLVNDMASKISATVTEKDSGLSLDFKGEIFPSDVKKILTGDASFSIQKPQTALSRFDIPVLADILKQPAVGSFAIDITPLEDKLDNLILRFGNDTNAFAMTTTLSYTPALNNAPSAYKGQIAVNSLSYNAFKPYFDKLNWAMLQKEVKNAPTIETKVNITDLIIPTGTIKDIEAEVTFDGSQFNVTAGRATLAGDMPITFRLNSVVQDNVPYLVGRFKGKTTQPDPFLTLVGLNKTRPTTAPVSQEKSQEEKASTTTVSIGSLMKQIDVDTTITWNPDFISIVLENLSFDATNVRGKVSMLTGATKKSSIDLSIDNLNLDTYTGWTDNGQKISLADFPKELRKKISELSYFSDKNILFNSDFNALTWHNLPITKGKIAGHIEQGTLSISNAEFEGVATASLKLSGSASGIGTQTAQINDLSFSFNAAQLPLFMGRAGLTSNLPLINKATDVKAAGSLTNADNAWKTNMLFQLNEAAVKVNGTVAFVENETRWEDFNFNLSHPNFQKFLTLVNMNTDFVKNLNGPLRAQGILTGTDNDLSLKNTDVSIGTHKFAGSLAYTNADIKKLNLTLATPLIEAERFLPKTTGLFDSRGNLSQKPFNFSAWDNWDIAATINTGRLTYKALDLNDAKLALTLKDKVFTLQELSGLAHNNPNTRFGVSGSLSYVSTPSVKADFKLADLTIRPDFMIVQKFSYGGGKAELTGSINATGSSPADMISNLSGEGQIALQNGQFIGLDLAQVSPLVHQAISQNMSQQEFDTQMSRIMTLGKTPVLSTTGAFSAAKGVVRMMDMTVKTPSAIASPAQVSWNIPDNTLSITMPFLLNDLAKYPPIVIAVDMNKNARTYTPNYSDLSNTIAGIVTQDLTAKQQAQQQANTMAAMQAAADKENALKQAITDANNVVKNISSELQGISDEKSGALLQNAVDALSIVNQLAIKENKTIEQENMILEQARLAIIKANEAKKVAGEAAVNHANSIERMEHSAIQMVSKMEQMKRSLPHIAIIPKLTQNAVQNLNLIQSVKARLNNADTTGQTAALSEAANAYQAIESAYENVMRFDTSGVVYTNEQADSTENKVRGTIIRR